MFYFQIYQHFATIFSQEECDSLCKEFGLVARSLLLQAKNCGRLTAEKRSLDLLAELAELPNADKLIGNQNSCDLFNTFLLSVYKLTIN